MVYPASAADTLDYRTLMFMVAEHAATDKTRQTLRELLPTADRQRTEETLTLVDELLRLMLQGYGLPAVATDPIDEALPLLKIQNAVLPVELCLAIKDQTEAYTSVYKFAGTHSEEAPVLASVLRAFPPIPEIPAAINQVFERTGQVRSNASSQLAEIRQELARARQKADRAFYKVLKRYDQEGWLADIRESVSNDRRVLAIQAAFKSKVRGAFHGSSAKGSLMYLEPLECLDINAEVGNLLEEERREIQKILRELTKELAPYRGDIQGVDQRLQQMDNLSARAQFARKTASCLPILSNDGEMEIIQGVNPVLDKVQRERGGDVVPLNVTMDPSSRMLVISGPNAGGKSLALKTMGLFQMMLQSGLLIPTHPKSTMRWFDRIMVDLGDAQSVENELSTYSGKLAKMKDMLLRANENTLCLVDEFGSGSDPDLGSAMASACMLALHDSQCFAVMTTHYNSIKSLGESLDGAINANMAFDINTFEPKYELIMGVPGSSYTFEVAQRVGLPKRILKAAKGILDEGTLVVDRLLVGLQKQRSNIDRTRTQVTQRLEELEELKGQQEQTIADLERKLSKAADANAEVSEQLMWGKRLEQWATSWQKATTQKARNEVKDRIVRLVSERVKEEKKQRKRKESEAQKAKRSRLEKLLKKPIKVGDKVKVLNGGRQSGEVLEIRKDRYLIQLGGVLSTWAERKDFVLWDDRNSR